MYVFILILFLYNFGFSQINAYFTDQQNTIEKAFTKFIDSVQPPSTIYFCIYRVDNPTIIKSIDEAYKRGINIYAIFDSNVDVSVFENNFPYKKIGSTTKLMHNKFVVVESSKVWSGSYNFTAAANTQDNFALEIFSKELADIYKKAFWYIWQYEDILSANISEFNGREVHLLDGTKITAYFNPYSDIPQLKDVILENLQVAKDVYFAVCWFVDKNLNFKDIFLTLLNNSVNINGIIDDSEINYDTYYSFKQAGININFDSKKTYYEYGLMHHKFCVIFYSTEKPKVICGSSNWSQNGLCFGGYYENMLVIESENLAESFYREYQHLYNEIIDKDYLIHASPILITEVSPKENWIEVFVLESGNYNGWKLYSGYPKKLIKEFPSLELKKWDFLVVQMGSLYEETIENENYIIFYTTASVRLYNSDGVVYITDPNGNWIDAVGWSNRDGSMATQAKDVYYQMKARDMWEEGPQINEKVADIDLQLSLVDWSIGANRDGYSIQRYAQTTGLPKDTNSLYDWYVSFNTTKGYGYKEVISSTQKILEVDKNTNPFSPQDRSKNFTKINFNIPDLETVKTIMIFDLSGKEIIKLVDKDKLQNGATLSKVPSGSVIWDGKNYNGDFVTSGVYVVYLEAYNSTNGRRYNAKSIVVVANKNK